MLLERSHRGRLRCLGKAVYRKVSRVRIPPSPPSFAKATEWHAKDFERYLKSSLGKAFMNKHLISNHFKEALKKFNNGRVK